MFCRFAFRYELLEFLSLQCIRYQVFVTTRSTYITSLYLALLSRRPRPCALSVLSKTPVHCIHQSCCPLSLVAKETGIQFIQSCSVTTDQWPVDKTRVGVWQRLWICGGCFVWWRSQKPNGFCSSKIDLWWSETYCLVGKKYRTDRSEKDDRPYPSLSLRFDYLETPLWGPGVEPLVPVGVWDKAPRS